ncbi:MAG: hypothetical protein ABIE70_11915 [bacterium]
MKYKIVAGFLILLLATAALGVESSGNKGFRPGLASNIDYETWIKANKLAMFVTNTGSFAYDNDNLLGGGYGSWYPFIDSAKCAQGVTNSPIYAGSIWAGGKDHATGELLITPGQHDTDWGPGPLVNGSPVSGASSNPRYRVYQLYSDSLEDNPNQDYLDWPVDDGAPVDEDGKPVMLGDEMLWSVYNDMDPERHVGTMGTVGRGLGLEVKQTFFAFDRVGALSNVVFARFQIYNKGGKDLDSVMISVWSDPDLGDASDDFVGCDTSLSLGFCYNEGEDSEYGIAPPAVGYDFFQGPLVETGDDADTAKMWGVDWVGYKNMGMTSFNKYINGTDPDTPAKTWAYMNGLDASQDPIGPVIDPITGLPTKFYGTGDPVAGTGFLDANSDDRRWMQTTGPFDLGPGDSTEILVAILCGQGTSELTSITELKAVDDFAQRVYDNDFVLPAPPANPNVHITELDREIILTWGDTSEVDQGDYTFEGYALVQGESKAGPWTDTLGWYDVVNDFAAIIDYQFNAVAGQDMPFVAKPGKNDGLQHYYRTKRDVTGGGNLVNNRPYYYKLEAYSVDTLQPNGEKTLTSQTIVEVWPHKPAVGVTTAADYLDTLEVTHGTVGGAPPSPGTAKAYIVDPLAVTGHDYKVVFETDPELGPVWHVIDETTGDTVVQDWANQSDLLGENNWPIFDGVVVEVAGPPFSFTSFQVVANADGPIDPPEAGAAPWYDFPVPTDVDPDGYPTDGQQVGEGLWLFHTADNGGTSAGGTRGGYDAFLGRVTRDGGNNSLIGSFDYEMRFTGDNANPGVGGGYAAEAFNDDNVFWVPFELWRIGASTPDDPSDDVRLVPLIIDDAGPDFEGDDMYALESWGTEGNGGGDWEHSVSGGDNDPYTDWVYWYTPTDMSPGDAGYLANEADMLDGEYSYEFVGDELMARTVLVNWNGGSEPPFNQDCPEQGTVFRIITAKQNSSTDEFTFSTAGYEKSVVTSGDEYWLDNIRAVPNPYYLSSGYDAGPENRVLKFTNLPAECTITIYNLAGDLVKTINKTDPTAVEAYWDVENEAGVPVGSGIYIYVVDAPAFGQKIGKMAVFTEVEVLDQF